MKCSKIEERNDSEVVYVYGAVVSVLAQFLVESVPWVWIFGHRPNQYLQWWKSTIPLNTDGASFSGTVRDLSVDLQMSTCDFISRSIDFDDHGLVLVQSNQQMPDTLCLERIPEQHQNNILMQNGAMLRIYLPHAIETAQVQCFRKGHLAAIIGS